MTFPPLFTGLALALVVSLGANAIMGRAYLGARDERAAAVTEATNSKNLATQCSEGVDSLRAAAERRATAGEAAARVALAAKAAAERKAQGLIGKRPSVPGDSCASAQVQIDDWLSTRGAK